MGLCVVLAWGPITPRGMGCGVDGGNTAEATAFAGEATHGMAATTIESISLRDATQATGAGVVAGGDDCGIGSAVIVAIKEGDSGSVDTSVTIDEAVGEAKGAIVDKSDVEDDGCTVITGNIA